MNTKSCFQGLNAFFEGKQKNWKVDIGFTTKNHLSCSQPIFSEDGDIFQNCEISIWGAARDLGGFLFSRKRYQAYHGKHICVCN